MRFLSINKFAIIFSESYSQLYACQACNLSAHRLRSPANLFARSRALPRLVAASTRCGGKSAKAARVIGVRDSARARPTIVGAVTLVAQVADRRPRRRRRRCRRRERALAHKTLLAKSSDDDQHTQNARARARAPPRAFHNSAARDDAFFARLKRAIERSFACRLLRSSAEMRGARSLLFAPRSFGTFAARARFSTQPPPPRSRRAVRVTRSYSPPSPSSPPPHLSARANAASSGDVRRALARSSAG